MQKVLFNLGFTILSALTIGAIAMPGVVRAQQANQDIQITVFMDLNANSTQELATESAIGDWLLEFYSNQFIATGSEASQAVQDGIYSLPAGTAYICIAPDENWIQTAPNAIVPHPLLATWNCSEVAEAVSFGVFLVDDQSTGEVEENPTVIDRFTEKPTPEPNPTTEPVETENGVVLGATDSPAAVLAETGSSALIIIAAGVSIVVLSIAFGRKQKIYPK